MSRRRESHTLGAPASPPAPAVATTPRTGCAGVPAGLLKKTREAAGLAPCSLRRLKKERPSASRVDSVAAAPSARPLLVALFLLISGAVVAAETEQTGLGSEPTAEELGAAGYSVFPDGKGLPAGRGSAVEGKAVYQQFCAACHGRNAQGEDAAALVGGRDSLTSDRPWKTVESYWPYATTLWDYVRRSMPYEAPGSLTNDEIYAVVAHLLNLMGLVTEDAVLDRESLPKVEMPNRGGFVPDDRPDTH